MPYILPFLTHIINMCIEKSYFPTSWKCAYIIPTPKIKQPIEFSHLRAISILPALSKILEKILDMQIRKFIDLNNILPRKQSGFRPGHSCATALADIVDDILTANDNSKLSILILLDYTKAFDMLNREILLAILAYIGFGINSQNMISSFLSERTQQVVLNHTFSEAKEIKTGVPQGSVLGPLLYTLYTSEFNGCLRSCDYHQYADDTQLYYAFETHQMALAIDSINEDLKSLYEISQQHLLQLNPKKCCAVLFGNKRNITISDFIINIDGTPIQISESCKSLGVIIDSNLKFKEHVAEMTRRAYTSLKMMFSHRHCLNERTKKTLSDSLVLSHFNHCDIVYGPCLNASERTKIQRVQNSCLRFIYGMSRRAHITPKLQTIGWLSMTNRRQHHLACLCYKILKNKTPPYLLDRLKFRTDVHNVNLRKRNIISLPKHRGEKYKGSFSYSAAACVNSWDNFNHLMNISEFIFRKYYWTYVFSQQ